MEMMEEHHFVPFTGHSATIMMDQAIQIDHRHLHLFRNNNQEGNASKEPQCLARALRAILASFSNVELELERDQCAWSNAATTRYGSSGNDAIGGLSVR